MNDGIDHSVKVINPKFLKFFHGVIRFDIAEYECKGEIILMSTKIDLDPLIILELYSKRWLIDKRFKTAVHEIGTFFDHYWMKDMKPQGCKTKLEGHWVLAKKSCVNCYDTGMSPITI